MKLIEFGVENYRSIEKCNLNTKNFNILIGKNNAGKSNLLRAIDDYRLLTVSPDKVGSENNTRNISEWFENSVTNKDTSRNISFLTHYELSEEEYAILIDRLSSTYEMSAETVEKIRGSEGFNTFEHQLTIAGGGIVRNTVQANIDGNDVVLGTLETGSSDIWQHLDFGKYPESTDTVASGSSLDLPLNVFPQGFRDLVSGSLQSWAWVAPFRKPEDQRPVTLEEDLESTGENLADKLFEIRDDHTDRFDRIEKAYSRIMEGVNGIRVPPRNADGEIIASVLVEEDGLDDAVPLKFISSGSKEILYLITRIVLAKDSIHFLFIEEPELHLHPAAEQEIFDLIHDASNKDGGPQVMISTHSDVFVNETDISKIISIKRDGFSSVEPISGGIELEQSLATLGYEKSDIIQSDRVLFVEGRSDKIILETLSGVIDREFSKHGVSLRVMGGDPTEDEIGPMTDLLGHMKIPYKFLFDSDGDDPERKKVSKASEINESPNKVEILEKYCIESYFVERPRTVADAINVEEAKVQAQLGDMNNISNKKNVLNEIFKEYVGTSYNEENHGAMIARQFTASEIDEELTELINTIVEMEGR